MFDRYLGSVDHPDWHELLWLASVGAAIGVVSGFAAVVFRFLIAFFHNLAFCGTLSFSYNSLYHAEPAPWGVGIIVVPVVGAIIVAFLVKNCAPRARSHGVPEVMEAIYYKSARLPLPLALVKAVTSAISIGSGGSIGREGPIIQITASLGSAIGGWLNLPGRVRTVLLSAAAAGGVAGSFETPLAGILFTVELFLPAVSAAALLPVTLSAFVSSLTVRSVFGHMLVLPFEETIPGVAVAPVFHTFTILICLGIFCGLIATFFVMGICRGENFFQAYLPNYYIRHSFGMLLVGLELYFFCRFTGFYYVEGFGYPTIYALLRGTSFSLGFLILLLLGKMVATCLTLGSGGSGGVFCPSLFLGAVTGALAGDLLHWVLPGVEIPRALLVMACMSAMVGSATGALLTGVVMVAELTGNYQAVAAAAIAGTAAFAVRRVLIGGGIYTQKLIQRGKSIPEGLQSSVWSSRRARDLMTPLLPTDPSPEGNFISAEADADLDAVLRAWEDSGADGIMVMENGQAVGILRDRELGISCREMAERML